MNHVRYPRAAVAVGTLGKPANTSRQKFDLQESTAPQVLWASLALRLCDGCRLVGVRRRGAQEVEVARMGPGHTAIEWVPARLALTDQEARHWLKAARFSRQ